MWENLDLTQLNTIIQLSVALNVVCIATDRIGQFTKIIEDTVLKTEEYLKKRLDEIEAKITTGLISASLLLKNPESEIIARAKPVQKGYKDVQSIVSREEPILRDKLNRFCRPKHMDGLSACCAIIGVIGLFLIFFSLQFDFIRNIYVLYFVLSLIPISIFTAVKIYKDKFLHKKFIKSNDTKDKYSKRNDKVCSFLVVKNGAIFSFSVLVVSFIIYFLNYAFIFEGIILGTISNEFILVCCYFSPVIPYMSFLIYIVVYYLTSQRRKSYMNSFFAPIDENIDDCDSRMSKIHDFINLKCDKEDVKKEPEKEGEKSVDKDNIILE